MAATRLRAARLVAARVLTIGALVLYNWWFVTIFSRDLLPSADVFFSDLEATGQTHAQLFQHLDLAAGILLLAAIALRAPRMEGRSGNAWRWLLLFASATAVGGLSPYACAPGASAACRAQEWHFALPVHHYLHMVAGVTEFAAITFLIGTNWRRTRGEHTREAVFYRTLSVVLAVGYPLLGVAYLAHRWGALVEPVFFVAFSVAFAFALGGMSPVSAPARWRRLRLASRRSARGQEALPH